MKKQYGIALALVLSMTSGLHARTVLSSSAKSRAAGHVSGRVETIMKDLRLSAEEKREALSIEYTNMKTMGLESHEPALMKKLEAYLGIATHKVERISEDEERFNKRAVAKRTPAAKPRAQAPKKSAKKAKVVTPLSDEPTAEDPGFGDAPLGGESGADEPLNDAFLAYGTRIIEASRAYADRFGIEGMPQVSEQRRYSLESFLSRASVSDNAFLDQVKKVHEKVVQVASGNPQVQSFVSNFAVHMKEKYEAYEAGMTDEIMFRVLELLLYAPSESDATLESYAGSFVETYNRYVKEEFQMGSDDLSGSAHAWAEKIIASSRAQAPVMFILSFAMERVKGAVKREPMMQQVHDSLTSQTAKLVTQLRDAGVEISSEVAAKPIAVAMKCSEYLQEKAPLYGSMEPAQQRALEALVDRVQTINQIVTDFEVVSAEMADTSTVSREHESVQSLSEEQQELLRRSSQLDHDIMDEAMFGDFDEDKDDSSIGKKLMLGALVAVVAVGLGYAVKNGKFRQFLNFGEGE